MSTELKITVFMPVYNSAAFLKESIDSVLQQTFTDFELLIVDDCSSDLSVSIIKTYKDKRIRLIQLEQNVGVAAVRNIGLTEARGKYIAFLDSDDIAYPDRLAKQYSFMEANPAVGVCGTHAAVYGLQNRQDTTNPLIAEEIKAFLLFESAIINTAAFFRRAFLEQYNLRYNIQYKYLAEDYEFWLRCSEHFLLANIPEVLVAYRARVGSTSRENRERNREIMAQLYFDHFQRIGLPATRAEAQLHDLIRYTGPKDFTDTQKLEAVRLWLEKIAQWNTDTQYYEEKYLLRYLGQYWYESCLAATGLGLKTLFRHRASKLSSYYRPHFLRYAKFIVRCLL
jgi:glycosyltransferase involved in cell wall biosynthesis